MSPAPRGDGDVPVAVQPEAGSSSGSGSGARAPTTPKSRMKASPRRAFHHKVKTGCQTCKIRRVKCDELRPACLRCISTGRACDGYEPAELPGPRDPLPDSPRIDLHRAYKLSLPRSNHDETRSYRYFVDVAAPALAGVFDTDFWLHDIPRVSHGDSAIWHAVVSLGATYELYLGCREESAVRYCKLRTLALQQYSKSVCSLLHSPHTQHDQWRALSISILFTSLCSLQGLHSEARVHMRSGRSILDEIRRGGASPLLKRSPPCTTISSPGTSSSSTTSSSRSQDQPVSIDPICIIMSNLKIQASAYEHGGLLPAQHVLAESSSYNIWRYYHWTEMKSRLSSLAPSDLRTRFARELLRANQAAESLRNGLIFHRQQTCRLTERIVRESSLDSLDTIGDLEKPYLRCYAELTRALACLEQVRAEQMPSTPWKGLDTLLLLLTTARLIFLRDPELPDHGKRREDLPNVHLRIIDLAERVLQTAATCEENRHPDSLVLAPLSIVAHGAPVQSIRRRAVALIDRYPLRDGLVDSPMQARVYGSMLDREQALLAGMGGESKVAEAEVEVPEVGRMFTVGVTFEGARSVQVVWRTWGEQFDGQPGERRLVEW